MLTDANQTIAWDATYDPFGKASITVSSVTNNLRFPGQYYDAETGLHYNWHCYYWPEVGRYVEGDPELTVLQIRKIILQIEEDMISRILGRDTTFGTGYVEYSSEYRKEAIIKIGQIMFYNYYLRLLNQWNVYSYVTFNPLIDFDNDGRISAVIGGAVAGCFLGSAIYGAIAVCSNTCISGKDLLNNMLKGCGAGIIAGAGWGIGRWIGLGSSGFMWYQRYKMLYKCLKNVF